MDPDRRIDAYCERTGPEFWAEPLNAVTNAAFVVAGIAALVLAERRERLDAPVLALSLLLVAIGIGSFLFHTFATAWAAVLDVAPITLFILGYFAAAMNRLVGFGWGGAALATVAFLAAMAAAGRLLTPLLAPLIGSSTAYVPALLGLVAVGAWLGLRGGERQRQAATGLLVAAALFTVSLAFRVADQPLCAAWPAGTHFLWHLLNAGVLFTVLLALVRHGRRPGPELAAPPAPGYEGRETPSPERP